MVSHNLPDVFQVADRLAVLYLGRLVSAGPASDYDTASAVDLMTTGALAADSRRGRGLPSACADTSARRAEPLASDTDPQQGAVTTTEIDSDAHAEEIAARPPRRRN